MRRLARWTLNALTALSLLLCVVTAGLWLRSYRVAYAVEALGPSKWYRVSAPCGRLLVASGNALGSNDQWLYSHYTSDAPWTELSQPFGSQAKAEGFHFAGFTVLTGDFGCGCIGVPLWLVAALSGWPIVRAARSQRCRTLSRCTCINCSYDLTGNVSGVCPECGTAVLQRTT